MKEGKIYKAKKTLILPFDKEAMLYLVNRGNGEWVIHSRKLFRMIGAGAKVVDDAMADATPAAPEEYEAEKRGLIAAILDVNFLREA